MNYKIHLFAANTFPGLNLASQMSMQTGNSCWLPMVTLSSVRPAWCKSFTPMHSVYLEFGMILKHSKGFW